MRLEFESRIRSEFTGWSGQTVFEFDNGQKWQQATYKYKYIYMYRPLARVWSEGSQYLLEVNGVDEKLPIRRM